MWSVTALPHHFMEVETRQPPPTRKIQCWNFSSKTTGIIYSCMNRGFLFFSWIGILLSNFKYRSIVVLLIFLKVTILQFIYDRLASKFDFSPQIKNSYFFISKPMIKFSQRRVGKTRMEISTQAFFRYKIVDILGTWYSYIE